LIFQTFLILWNSISGLKYLRSTTLGSEDTGIRKPEFVAETQRLIFNVFMRIFKILEKSKYFKAFSIFLFLPVIRFILICITNFKLRMKGIIVLIIGLRKKTLLYNIYSI